MAGNTIELVGYVAMDCDETVDFDIPAADKTLIPSSPEYWQLRSGRKIVKAKHKKSSCGVRKKKKRERNKQATNTPEGKRQRQIQRAIANGSRLFNGSEDNNDNSCVVQDQSDHLQRLTGQLVLQALFDQTPGLTFPSHPTLSPFSGEEIEDLVQALEDYHITLARKGTAIPSPDVAKLLKTFTHDVLCLLSRTKERRGHCPRANVLWVAMSHSFKFEGSKCWLKGAVMKKLDEIYGVGKAKHLRGARAINRAIVARGKCHELDLAVTYARQELGEPHYGHSATLRSLVGHFETVRTRYLSSINNSEKAAPSVKGDIDMTGSSGGTGTLQPRGMQPRRQDMESSDEEYDGLGDSGAEADVEDNVQVEGELLFGKDRALVQALDLWMELSKQDERQDSVDVDMMSALDLGRRDQRWTGESGTGSVSNLVWGNLFENGRDLPEEGHVIGYGTSREQADGNLY